MRVLAIDPGYSRLGIAILEKSGGSETLVSSECFQTERGITHAKRLAEIGGKIRRIIEENKPSHVCLERVFFTKNQKTALAVAEVRGVVLEAAAEADIPVVEFTPNQIKVAVTGHGASDKRQVEKMVRMLVTVPHRRMLDDEIDAIAVGLTSLAAVKYAGVSHRAPLSTDRSYCKEKDI